ncbi:MAG: hypothetical protein P1V51_24040 [Deltaproteobacteria bacterium]|nr:hypothetical protein [Deltaproteobacteria bacterium]
MSENPLNENEQRLIAYFDGELPEAEAREVEAYLEEHPEAVEALASFSLVHGALASAGDAWEEGVDFEGFSAAVMARIPEEQGAKRPADTREEQPGLWATFVAWLAGHPAFAAAATVMVVLGAGSVLYLNTPGSHIGPMPAFQLKGGATQIEDLSFESGSAVVYKTESDVTIVWLTEDDS